MNIKNATVTYDNNGLCTLTSLETLWEDLLNGNLNVEECSLMINNEFHKFVIEELFTDGITLRDKKDKRLLGVIFDDNECYWV